MLINALSSGALFLSILSLKSTFAHDDYHHDDDMYVNPELAVGTEGYLSPLAVNYGLSGTALAAAPYAPAVIANTRYGKCNRCGGYYDDSYIGAYGAYGRGKRGCGCKTLYGDNGYLAGLSTGYIHNDATLYGASAQFIPAPVAQYQQVRQMPFSNQAAQSDDTQHHVEQEHVDVEEKSEEQAPMEQTISQEESMKEEPMQEEPMQEEPMQEEPMKEELPSMEEENVEEAASTEAAPSMEEENVEEAPSTETASSMEEENVEEAPSTEAASSMEEENVEEAASTEAAPSMEEENVEKAASTEEAPMQLQQSNSLVSTSEEEGAASKKCYINGRLIPCNLVLAFGSGSNASQSNVIQIVG